MKRSRLQEEDTSTNFTEKYGSNPSSNLVISSSSAEILGNQDIPEIHRCLNALHQKSFGDRIVLDFVSYPHTIGLNDLVGAASHSLGATFNL